MTNFDLLQTVQPDDGYFAVVGIKEGVWTKQELVATREEVDALAGAVVDAKACAVPVTLQHALARHFTEWR